MFAVLSLRIELLREVCSNILKLDQTNACVLAYPFPFKLARRDMFLEGANQSLDLVLSEVVNVGCGVCAE